MELVRRDGCVGPGSPGILAISGRRPLAGERLGRRRGGGSGDEGRKGGGAGDARSVVVSPAEGYGEHDPRGVREVPRSVFPEGFEPKAGMKLMFQGPNGKMPIVVREVRPEVVVVDHNHPLAGKELRFAVTVREVRAARPEELERGHACSGCGKHK